MSGDRRAGVRRLGSLLVVGDGGQSSWPSGSARSSRASGEAMSSLAARVSRRMMSMVTRWDQRRLRVTRASRA